MYNAIRDLMVFENDITAFYAFGLYIISRHVLSPTAQQWVSLANAFIFFHCLLDKGIQNDIYTVILNLIGNPD